MKTSFLTSNEAIRIDVKAYGRLKVVQKENESFSQVINREVRGPLDMQRFIKRIGDPAAHLVEFTGLAG